MPKIFYTQDEYDFLVYEKEKLQERVRVLKQLAPVNAMEGEGYQARAALSEVWKILGVEHQTACMLKLKDLKARNYI